MQRRAGRTSPGPQRGRSGCEARARESVTDRARGAGCGARRTARKVPASLLVTPAPVARARAGACTGAVPHRLELLEAATRADRDARERRLGEMRRHVSLLAEALVEALQER